MRAMARLLRPSVGGVLLDNFWLEGKDLFGLRGIHRSTHPVHIGTAEGLDAREVLDPLSGSRGGHRLVHPEGVGIAVCEYNGLAEGANLLFEGSEEVFVASVHLGGELEAGVGLDEEHERAASVGLGVVEAFADPL